jgi:hypothetical protein
MNIMELFAHIGLKADTPAAEAFNKSIGNIKGQLVGAIAGTLSLTAAIAAVNSQLSQSLAMQKFADDTGQSVEEMQKWKAVAQQVSGAGATVAESIKAISSNQAKIRLGQGNISGYQLLGIDSRSDPFEVLEALRTKTQGLSQSMRRNIASQFGISNDLVKTLELTNEEFDKLAANAFVIPQGNIDAMNKARSSLETVKNAVNFLVAEFVTALAPSIEAVSKKIAGFVRNHGAKLIEWIQYAIRTITRVADLVDKTIQKTIGWKNALLALAIVFIALNSAIMLPVAAIALLFIALEDIAAYSRGEDSLIGRYLKGMPAFKKVFDDLLATFDLLLTALGAVFSGDYSKLDEMTKKWGLFGDIVQVVAKSLGIINEGLSSESFNQTKEGIKEKGFFQEYADQWGNLGKMIIDTDWLGKKSNQAAVAAPVTVNNSPTININGAANPEVTGRYAAEAIARENQKAFDRLSGEKKEK